MMVSFKVVATGGQAATGRRRRRDDLMEERSVSEGIGSSRGPKRRRRICIALDALIPSAGEGGGGGEGGEGGRDDEGALGQDDGGLGQMQP